MAQDHGQQPKRRMGFPQETCYSSYVYAKLEYEMEPKFEKGGKDIISQWKMG